jgi:phage gp36-like protein
MAYCTVTDISSRFKSLLISSDTAVTTTEVEGFIDQYSALIDGRIGKRYVTPVDPSDSPISTAILQLICIWFVVAEVEPIVGQAPVKDSKGESRQKTFHEMAEDALAKIESGQTMLPDAEAVSSNTLSSYNVTNSVEAVFQKCRRQW